MDVRAISLAALSGGQSSKVAMSTTSAQSAAFTMAAGGGDVVVTPDAACFFRCGTNPTALSDGTDQYLAANQSYRITGILNGEKLAFIVASGTGNAYITPGA